MTYLHNSFRHDRPRGGRKAFCLSLGSVKIAIKNMVCNRCVMVVRSIFEKNGYQPESITLGEVILPGESVPAQKLEKIDADLKEVGFERIDDRKVRLIERLKNLVIKKIHHADFLDRKFNWSTVLAGELHYDYNYLSTLFSSIEGTTLEHYIISQKIERVKELLFYDELSMAEIADRLGYSSVQHLSGQFRKVTGFTPTQFRKSRQGAGGRKSIDAV
jgi:AraC family transcriptional regulator